MAKQTQKPAKAAIVIIPQNRAKAFADGIAKAFTGFDGAVNRAGSTMMLGAVKAYAALKVTPTEEAFKMFLQAPLAAAFKDAGQAEGTVIKNVSYVRSVILGLAKGMTPVTGETFRAFAARSTLERKGKAGGGRKARTPDEKKSGGAVPSSARGEAKGENEGEATGPIAYRMLDQGAFQRACALVAGYMARKQRPALADDIRRVFGSEDGIEQFQRFAATFRSEDPSMRGKREATRQRRAQA